MVGLFFKSLGVFLLLCASGSLGMRVVAYFNPDINGTQVRPALIQNANAQTLAAPNPFADELPHEIRAAALQQTALPPQSVKALHNNSRPYIILRFEADQTSLDAEMQSEFEHLLRNYSLTPASQVQVSMGPTKLGKTTYNSQNSKLRAQNVARAIFPYTQDIRILMRPEFEAETLLLEFAVPNLQNHPPTASASQ